MTARALALAVAVRKTISTAAAVRKMRLHNEKESSVMNRESCVELNNRRRLRRVRLTTMLHQSERRKSVKSRESCLQEKDQR